MGPVEPRSADGHGHEREYRGAGGHEGGAQPLAAAQLDGSSRE
jgi:hypothetical protein